MPVPMQPMAAQQMQPTGIGLLDTLIQMIQRDPMGSIGGGGFGTIVNPQAMEAQTIQKWLPQLWQALMRSRNQIQFGEMPGSIPRSHVAAMTGLHPNTQGNVSMMFPPGATLQTMAHEGLHALYAGKTGGASMLPPRQYGRSILESLRPSPGNRDALLGLYNQNEPHAALAAMASKILQARGLIPPGLYGP